MVPAGPAGPGGSPPAGTARFSTGQEADFMLSGLGFNRAGGGLLFNHPRSLASDGTRLALSDGQNNRVLLWRTAPSGNTAPDLVLGQVDFEANESGTGLDRLSWPGQVAFDDQGRLLVADTWNDRLLVWNGFPSRSGQPADLAIAHPQLKWPWGLWSGGGRLFASSTGGGAVLGWNAFPASGSTPPAFVLQGSGLGTPRTFTSDGTTVILGDHNANGSQSGNWVWKTLPVAGGPPDFFLQDPQDPGFGWLQGCFAADGALYALGRNLYRWDAAPAQAGAPPQLSFTGHRFEGGDGGGAVLAGGRLYVLEYNGNRIAAFNQVPTAPTAVPDFAIGSPSLSTNTLRSHGFITNGVPVTDGQRLIVSSDYERRVVGWNSLPTTSGVLPDWSLDLDFQPWDNALAGGRLLLAGGPKLAIWNAVPTQARTADLTFTGAIDGITFSDLAGVAWDGTRLFLADRGAGKVHVWLGLPGAGGQWQASLAVPGVTRLDADGTWLVAVATLQQSVHLFRIADLASGIPARTLSGAGSYNLPQGACLSEGRLLIANTQMNQVLIWNRIEDAAAGLPADAVLGSQDKAPRIGKSGLFWPGALAAAGSDLWVGEFKFGNRLVHYTGSR